MVGPLLVIVGAVVVWAEGPGLLAAWNLLPVLVVAGLARGLHRDAGHRWGGVDFHALGAFTAFALTALSASLYVHVAWALDIDGMRTENEGAGMVFVLLPIGVLAAGLLAYPVGWLLARLVSGRVCT